VREFLPLPERRSVAVLGRDGALRTEERPLPPVESGDLCFRLLAAGLSREDMDPARHAERVPPGVPVGEIVAAGDGARGWSPLDRALLLPPTDPGLPRLEGLASYIHVPRALVAAQAVVKLSLEMPADSATLLPATAYAARLLSASRVPSGGSLLVLGLPLHAQILLLLARHQKVEALFAVDPSATLRRRAEWSGATLVFSPQETSIRDAAARLSGGAGINAAVVVASEGAWIHEALQSLAVRGTLVLAAQDPHLVVALHGGWLVRREIRIEGVPGFDRKYLKDARQALEQGIVNTDTLVSRRLPWSDLSAFRPEEDYWRHGLHVVVEGPDA
jgi:threonine dehydrogenase-like Zn-dependent dehydrogenase